ncbi:MAG: hypothetical protein ABII93_01150 [Chrysiogenia bacterium]
MSIFSKKPEVNFKQFCKDFYDNQILNPKIGAINFGGVFPVYVKESIIEVDQDFEKVEILKLTNELMSMRFELFALAWIYEFGLESAVDQSIFTKNYLNEKELLDIWKGMEHYNKAISSSAVVDVSEREKVRIFKLRADMSDKFIAIADKKSIIVDEAFGWPINRLDSDHAWKQRKTAYFLMLGLCHKLGLGYGPNYYGPNKEAQIRLMAFINGFFEGAKQSWANTKILN